MADNKRTGKVKSRRSRDTWPERAKILQGLRASAEAALETARRTGTPLIFWRDGKIVEVMPEQLSS